MELGLNGKIVLITGASIGIGRVAAEIFANEKSNLIIGGRNKENIEKTAQELKIAYPNIFIQSFCCDVHTAKGSEQLVDIALKAFNRIDVLVNNTDGPPLNIAEPEKISDQEWLNAFSGKLHAYIRMINLVLPSMRKQQWGRIINIVGTAGKEKCPLGTSGLPYVSRRGRDPVRNSFEGRR